MSDSDPAHRLFALVYDPATALFERTLLAPHRRYLARGAAGELLDLGAGTGAQFAYVGADATLHAVEPDPHMRRRAAERAAELGLSVDLRDAAASALPYPDGSMDVVVASMVFCTVPDPAAALDEVARVLRPGGEFRFLEHVADDGWRERVQRLAAPLWERAAGGCHLTRRTAALFASHDAFDVVELERFSLGVTPLRPFVRGTLRKRA